MSGFEAGYGKGWSKGGMLGRRSYAGYGGIGNAIGLGEAIESWTFGMGGEVLGSIFVA